MALMKRKTGTLACAIALLASSPVMARDASCYVQSEGKVLLDQKCDFQAVDGDGSFSLSSRGKKEGALFPDVLSLSLTIIKPGLAEVRGLTKDGINSRWGEARRSTKDGACWEGSGFRICAR
jgi:hypothetical protein